jgi:hypothetical protein
MTGSSGHTWAAKAENLSRQFVKAKGEKVSPLVIFIPKTGKIISKCNKKSNICTICGAKSLFHNILQLTATEKCNIIG